MTRAHESLYHNALMQHLEEFFLAVERSPIHVIKIVLAGEVDENTRTVIQTVRHL